MIGESDIIKALSHVDDPDLKKDLVSLNMIRDLKIEGKSVSFSVCLTTPACPLKDEIERACRNAISHFCGEDLDVKIKMISDVKNANSDSNLPGVKNIIVVASGKGGVGKSTIAAGIALALSNAGAKTGLMDADIYGPSVPSLFELEGRRIETETINGQDIMLPVEHHGLKLFSMGFLSSTTDAMAWRGPMASSAIKQFITGVKWGELDYLIVDLPPGTGDIQITIAQNMKVQGAVIVSTPQKLALADALRACTMFSESGLKIPLLGVIENMSWFSPPGQPDIKYRPFGAGHADVLSQKFNTEILAELPLGNPESTEGLSADNNIHQNIKIFTEIAGRIVQKLAVLSQSENRNGLSGQN